MLDARHYDLLVKYDSAESLDFNSDELAILFDVLNLDDTPFAESRLAEYRDLINRTAHEQNRVMTEIGGEYLSRANEASELEAFRYLVDNITRIRSPYMLNILIGLLAYKAQ